MRYTVYPDRFYLIDSISGSLDPVRGENGYKTRSDARFELFCSRLEHPVIRKGSLLINRNICGAKTHSFE